MNTVDSGVVARATAETQFDSDGNGTLLDSVIENTRQVYGSIDRKMGPIESLGKHYFASGLLDLKHESQGIVVALTCMCEGITPIEFGRRYHLIQGRLSMRADRMLAEFRQRGGTYRIVSRTADRAEIEMEFAGNHHSFSMTLDDAKGERYYYAKDGKSPKDNWSTPRGTMQMLWSRVCSDGVRVMCPEIVAGIYTPEETGDFDGSETPAVADAKPKQSRTSRKKELEELAKQDVAGEAVGTTAAQNSQSAPVDSPAPATSDAELPFVPDDPQMQSPVAPESTSQPPRPQIDHASGSRSLQSPATVEQLGQLADLGMRCGKTLDDVATMCVKTYGCQPDLSDLPSGKAAELIARFEAAISEKRKPAI